MPVIYDGSKIIPAPFVAVSKTYQKSGGGDKLGSLFTLTLSGTLLPNKGSPIWVEVASSDYNGNFWNQAGDPPCEDVDADERMASLLRKQESIRSLFKDDGLVLEFQPWDGTTTMSCNPRVVSIDFEAGPWVEKCDYTITVECDRVYGLAMDTPEGEDDFSEFISAASESWSLEFGGPQDDATPHLFSLSHSVSAVGKSFYKISTSLAKPAWQQARDFVLPRLGYDSSILSGGAIAPSGVTPYDHVRSESINELSGEYAVTETFILASDSATDDYSVSTTTSVSDAISVVSISGTITGFEVNSFTSGYSNTISKFTNAEAKFVTVEGLMITRATVQSGLVLNVIPSETIVGKNPVSGVITYSYSYNDRANSCITDSLSEDITVVDDNPGQVIAVIPVLGRASGPVLQDISTYTETKRNLSINAVMPKVEMCDTGGVLLDTSLWLDATPDVSAIITAVTPTGTQVFKVQDQETWKPTTGIYSRTIQWTYEV